MLSDKLGNNIYLNNQLSALSNDDNGSKLKKSPTVGKKKPQYPTLYEKSFNLWSRRLILIVTDFSLEDKCLKRESKSSFKCSLVTFLSKLQKRKNTHHILLSQELGDQKDWGWVFWSMAGFFYTKRQHQGNLLFYITLLFEICSTHKAITSKIWVEIIVSNFRKKTLQIKIFLLMPDIPV